MAKLSGAGEYARREMSAALDRLGIESPPGSVTRYAHAAGRLAALRDQYGHLLPGAEDEAADLLNAFLARQLGGTDPVPTAPRATPHPSQTTL